MTTDNLKIAQFIYLLLRNPEIRNVIDTLTAKVVLILGRFTPERKGILEALRIALRARGLVPVLFDFDRPANRDVSETVLTLACMSLFVIADLSAPRGTPLELQLMVPQVMVPVVPIIQEKEQTFEMFRNLKFKYDWVLKPLRYHTEDDLIGSLEKEHQENAVRTPDSSARKKRFRHGTDLEVRFEQQLCREVPSPGSRERLRSECDCGP